MKNGGYQPVALSRAIMSTALPAWNPSPETVEVGSFVDVENGDPASYLDEDVFAFDGSMI